MNEKREIQKEFFQDIAQSPKFRKKILQSSAAKKVHNISLSNEQFIFTFIGFIILLLLCFSLGVERGKRIVAAKAEEEPPEARVVAEERAYVPAGDIKAQEEPKKEETKEEPAVIARPLSPYLIQVATYTNAEQAQGEKKFLENKGYAAEVGKSGKYSVVYVGGFADKKEADDASKKLRDRYKDCLVKKRK